MKRPSTVRIGIATLVLWSTPAWAESAPATAPEEEEDLQVVLSTDGWYLRLDVGGAYTRTTTRFHPSGDDSAKEKLELEGWAPTLALSAGGRLGSDVVLGGLFRVIHVPRATSTAEGVEGRAGTYFGELFLDHRLPARILHLGGGIGPGYVYSIGPANESFGAWGPVASVWLGLDAPTGKRVALGLVADFTGAAIRETHVVRGTTNEFQTFMLAMGLAITLRISEPSLPRSLPSIATRD